MALNDSGVYVQMEETFYKGELVGEAMSKCHIMVENSVKTFFDKQVNMLILTHKYREIVQAFISSSENVFFTCLVAKDLLSRLGAEHWNIVKETVHLVWAYGQKGHPLEKKNLQGWNGTKMYQTFYQLDTDDKDFQVVA
jgi:hypothetical protein